MYQNHQKYYLMGQS